MAVSEEVVQAVQSRLGSTIDGKWTLTRVLGIGGMAAVYAATHRNQNRIAIKMLHEAHSRGASMRARFLREGYVANTVEHPGAVRVFDDGIADGAAYLVMELLEGETLEDRHVRLGGRLPAAEVLALADQLLDVLAAAHDKGIVHRDIKPDNLFLVRTGQLKVLDFGIAHLKEVQPTGGTSTQMLMGTPSFMPPEQARARWAEVDGRSDIWATGATLYYLLSGHLVHEGDTYADQLAQAVREPVRPLNTVDPGIPRVVAEVVDRALAYAPADRWQSARNMQTAVRRAQKLVGPPLTSSVRAQEDPSDPSRTETPTLLATDPPQVVLQGSALTPGGSGSTPPHPKRNWLLIGAVALALAVALLAFWSFQPGASGPAEPVPAGPMVGSSPVELAPERSEPSATPSQNVGEPAIPLSAPPVTATARQPAPVKRPPASERPSAPSARPAAASGPAPSSAPNLFDKRF
jgi:eukaryotic-like serine/threonine-protein kinase